MKRKTIFYTIGWLVVLLLLLMLMLTAVYKIKTGHGGDAYENYFHQKISHFSLFFSLSAIAIASIPAMVVWVKRAFEKRFGDKSQKGATEKQ